MQYKDIYGSYD